MGIFFNMHTTNLVSLFPFSLYFFPVWGWWTTSDLILNYSSTQLVHLKLPSGGADRKCPGEVSTLVCFCFLPDYPLRLRIFCLWIYSYLRSMSPVCLSKCSCSVQISRIDYKVQFSFKDGIYMVNNAGCSCVYLFSIYMCNKFIISFFLPSHPKRGFMWNWRYAEVHPLNEDGAQLTEIHTIYKPVPDL